MTETTARKQILSKEEALATLELLIRRTEELYTGTARTAVELRKDIARDLVALSMALRALRESR